MRENTKLSYISGISGTQNPRPMFYGLRSEFPRTQTIDSSLRPNEESVQYRSARRKPSEQEMLARKREEVRKQGPQSPSGMLLTILYVHASVGEDVSAS